MRTVKDVEAYLERLRRRHAPVEGEAGTYVVQSSSEKLPPIAVRVDPPLVVVRVHVGDVPKDPQKHVDVFRKLLVLNAKTLVHTSFGLEDTRIVLTSALELENLDFNELEATMDEIDLTLAQQVPMITELAKK